MVPAPPNHEFQVIADFAFKLAGAYGVMVDGEKAEMLDGFYAQREYEAAELLRQTVITLPTGEQTAIMRRDCDSGRTGSISSAAKREVTRRAWASIGEPPRLTPKSGEIQTDAKVFEYLAEKGADDPMFALVQSYNRAVKFRATYIAPVVDAASMPGVPICPNYNVLVSTGRASCKGPNLTNYPSRVSPAEQVAYEAGTLAVVAPMLREQFVPRPGHAFVFCDYTALEMATLAQVLCTRNGGVLTPLGESINTEGDDQHLRVAAVLLGCSYEEAVVRYEQGDPEVKDMRKVGKMCNFSLAGMASAQTLRVQARSMGVDLTPELAARGKRAWEHAMPEMRAYFAWVEGLYSYESGKLELYQFGPGGRQSANWRFRRADRATQMANSPFQGLAADGAKYAWIQATYAALCTPDSPLFGARPLFFIHDEIGIEVPIERAEAAGHELSRVMVAAMRKFTPDIKIRAPFDPAKDIHTDCWRKG